MISQEEIQSLFDILKDNLEFDRDVMAITKILKKELEIDFPKAIKNWKYLLNKYDLKTLSEDINMKPLTTEFPLLIIENAGIQSFLTIRGELSDNNKFLIDNAIFNTFKPNEGISLIVEDLINQKKEKEEMAFIDSIIAFQRDFPKEIFDITEFLYNIILWHLEKREINLNHLKNICLKAPSIKEQTILRAMFIDYQ